MFLIMKIDELCEYAKYNGFDSLEFEFTNIQGVIKKCKWLDAYFGFFLIEGNDGFITTKQWKEITGDVFEFRLLNIAHNVLVYGALHHKTKIEKQILKL